MSGRQGLSSASAQQRVTPDAARLQRTAGDLGSGLRLPTFVGVATTLAVAAHAAADRMLPGPGALTLSVALVAVLALALRGRERSFEAITAALLGCQVVVHLVLCLAPSGHATAAATTGHPGHPAAGGAGLLALYPGNTMLIAHLLAAGVAGWWLHKGEAAVWAAVGWIWPVLAGGLPTAVVPVVASSAGGVATATVGLLRDRVDATAAHPRRGPPAAAVLVSAA